MEAGRGFSVYPGGAVNHDALLTVTQAARLARVSKQLVNWWRSCGLLPGRRIGGTWHYRVGDILQVERDTRRSPQSRRAA